MSGHVERVEALIAEGRIEDAKATHNAAVVLARKRAKSGLTLRKKLPEFERAKRALDRAATPQRR